MEGVEREGGEGGTYRERRRGRVEVRRGWKGGRG